jgi:hypothetical protein
MSLEKSGEQPESGRSEHERRFKWELTAPKAGPKYVHIFRYMDGYYIQTGYIYLDNNFDIYIKAVMREYQHRTELGYVRPKIRKRILKFHKDGCYLSFRGSALLIRNLKEVIDTLVALELVERQELQ